MESKNLEISCNIRFYRKAMGLTQEGLANLLGGKKSLVSNYENGYSTPDIYTLIQMADIFDVSLDELVGRTLK
jgi:transcriptional regulator with XRE-family HTH domain